jgi:hypothetical protein
MQRCCYNDDHATTIVLSNFERVAMAQVIVDLQASLSEFQ